MTQHQIALYHNLAAMINAAMNEGPTSAELVFGNPDGGTATLVIKMYRKGAKIEKPKSATKKKVKK